MSLIIVFRNISMCAPVSDYVCEVMIGDGTAQGTRTIDKRTIKGHKREDGWEALVQKLVKETAHQ